MTLMPRAIAPLVTIDDVVAGARGSAADLGADVRDHVRAQLAVVVGDDVRSELDDAAAMAGELG